MANNWVDPSQDLLEMICDNLISPDCITLQSVCKSWRATLKNSSSRLRELPWLLMLPKDKEEDPDAFEFFSLSKQKIFSIRLPEVRGKRCCGSFQNGWLMAVDIDLNISLFHPWSKKTLQLPHQSTFKHQNYVDEK
ncbi:hypothetical protein MRB53_022845 [Persea americana]|uniref:Uncharacterized protein n=1 Tax=Persea americana TaxID=3435 RepID=A0ACC2L8T6_PERAE|nr:hypothetical protein MRB53_022845 [Persea americana]